MKLSAIDTETVGGSAIILSTEFRKWEAHSFEECVNPIFSDVAHGNISKKILAWNMGYDSLAILKYLPDKNINELIDNLETQYNNYQIFYIPRKILRIKDKHRSFTIYDIAQFYNYMKLDTAGKEYVGDQKEDSYIIRQITKWAYTHTDNELYWIFAHNKEEIMHYCQQDAKLTLKLGYLLNEENKSIFGFYLNTFASKAQIGKILTKNNCDTYKFVGKDGKTHSKMLYPEFKEDYNPAKYATAAYHGGIFDVMKRGTFGEVTDIDISSAYHSHQHTLPH